MPTQRCLPLALLLVLLAAGCDGSHIKAKGRIVKGGQPFLTQPGEGLRIMFSPVEATGTRYDSYAAAYHAGDGTFQVTGKDGAGLPPGKYRVSLELMKNRDDLWKGKLRGRKSPYTIEVARGSGDVVLDLDQATAKP
jgi:hypothetical protein